MTIEFMMWYLIASLVIVVVTTLANAYFMPRDDALCYGVMWFIFWPLFACLFIALLPLCLLGLFMSALEGLFKLLKGRW